MGNALWLVLALPKWYFSTILAPLSAGPLTIVPAIGVICLVIGTALGILRKQKLLLAFIAPFLLSELFVAISGFYRGRLPGSAGNSILLIFLLLTLITSSYVLYRAKGARLTGTLLFVFSLTYALFAAFVAAMSFSDSWL
ncbi:hypothetical protein [uncultured Sphingomonas sp.]|uniref:hypothetical protein n=1 Tax=uncultured Sphingomonas sp. TaxID=158754 RepID=UPI0035CA6BB9